MLRRCLLIASLLALTGFSAAGGPNDPPGEPRPLFNGKDLAGWDGDSHFWSVKDGAITGATTAENPAKGNTFLIWKGGRLRNFELRAKFRLQGGNSGIQYRSKDLGNWVVSGYQADMDAADAYTGIIYEERGRGILAKVGEKATVGADGKPQVTGSVGDAAAIRAVFRKGEWNDYLITARDNHLAHAINGRVTAELVDNDEQRRAMEGILALQLHAGPPMTVQFKEIMLRVLDAQRQ
jgi:hypothetical protein